jgi:hypothetical protein
LSVHVALNGNVTKEFSIRAEITDTKVKILKRYPTSPLVKIIIATRYIMPSVLSPALACPFDPLARAQKQAK